MKKPSVTLTWCDLRFSLSSNARQCQDTKKGTQLISLRIKGDAAHFAWNKRGGKKSYVPFLVDHF